MIKCGNCGGQHGTVADVRQCCGAGDVLTAEQPPEETPGRALGYGLGYGQTGMFNPSSPATDAQKGFVARLLVEKDVPDPYRTQCQAYIRPGADNTRFGATQMITRLKEYPKAAAGERSGLGADQDGMYRNPHTGEIFKVQVAVHGSGGLYAKQLVLSRPGAEEITEVALTGPYAHSKEEATGWDVDFRYAPGAVKRLRPEWRMSLEDAKAFGALYGTCCVCGRTLTNEDSIAAGIGPICAGKV